MSHFSALPSISGTNSARDDSNLFHANMNFIAHIIIRRNTGRD